MTHDTLIAAGVQAAPVFLDREGTVAKAAGLIAEPAADGARGRHGDSSTRLRG